jgi:hypothetical protein
LAWDRGAGHFFGHIISQHLTEHISVSGQFSKIKCRPLGEAQQNRFCAFPILLCRLCCSNIIGAANFTPLTGEAR